MTAGQNPNMTETNGKNYLSFRWITSILITLVTILAGAWAANLQAKLNDISENSKDKIMGVETVVGSLENRTNVLETQSASVITSLKNTNDNLIELKNDVKTLNTNLNNLNLYLRNR